MTGDEVTFDARYSDGTSINNKALRVKKYDLSCIPAVADGTACTSDQVYCIPSGGSCPSGYELVTSGEFDLNFNCYTVDEPTCIQRGGSSSRTCSGLFPTDGSILDAIAPTVISNTYNKCDATQTIGQSQCGDFSNIQYTAPAGKVCIVDATGQVGEGVGKLQCPESTCSIGEKIKTSETTYQECIAIGTCEGFGSEITCPSSNGVQTIFDEDTGQCAIPQELTCSPNEAECVGSSIRTCDAVNIGGVRGYVWNQNTQICPGETQCSQDNLNINDAYCSCENVDEQYTVPEKCSGSDLLEYSKDPSDVNSCLSYRDLGNNLDESQICQNGVPTTRIGCKYDNPTCTDGFTCDEATNTCQAVGCQFGTPGYECSTRTDLLGQPLEQCLSNQCVSVSDDFGATQEEFLSGATRCDVNTIYKVNSYSLVDRGSELGTTNVYRWEIDTQAENSINGVCSQDFLCIELLSGNKALCTTSAQFIGIISQTSYGIGENVGDVEIQLTSEVPNRANKKITALLYDGEVLLKRLDTQTNSLGQVTLNFEYAHERQGELTIEVIAGEVTGQNFRQSKTINIQSSLDIRLNCPSQGFIDRVVKCTWRVENVETGSLVNAQTEISVTQGGTEVIYAPLGTDSFSFITSNIGSVNVEVTAKKEGFISDIGELIVPIEGLTQAQTFEIDNVDFFTLGASGITTGAHQLTLEVKDNSGQLENVQTIDAEIITPSGQKVDLVFNKVSQGKFKSTYNFAQAGTSYTFKGAVIFEDLAKSNLPFEYTIATVGTGTESDKNLNLGITILISILVLVVFVIVIVFFLSRKKR
jgi:hypothetical protein